MENYSSIKCFLSKTLVLKIVFILVSLFSDTAFLWLSGQMRKFGEILLFLIECLRSSLKANPFKNCVFGVHSPFFISAESTKM